MERGGFTSALPLPTVGIERDLALALHGRSAHSDLRVVVGDVEVLPIRTGTVDVVVASLVVHQVEVESTLNEVTRVLRPSGRLVVRTVAPGDASQWVPHRWFPTVVAHQAKRMPTIESLEAALVEMGLECVEVARVERERSAAAAELVDVALRDVVPRYDLPAGEVDEGLAQIRAAESYAYVQTHTVLVARKPAVS